MLGDKDYKYFTDLLIDLKGIANNRQIDILIKLDFFKEFGKAQKLLQVKENFDKLMDKKQFKKDEFSHIEELLREFSEKESDKMFREVDTLTLCYRLEDREENIDIDFADKFKANMEFIGSCNITDDSLGKRVCIVTNVNTKYSPILTLYCIYNGRTTNVKMNTRLYESMQIELFDTIYVDKIEEKNKVKLVDGSWVTTSEKEKWLTKCRAI